MSVSEGVDLRYAAFVTLGGIAIQSLRRAEIQFGETVVVYGLGLVGQLCAMIAKAAGAIVIGVDIAGTLDAVDGAGRLLTEGEHFIEFSNLLVNQTPLSVFARALGDEPDDIRQLCSVGRTQHSQPCACSRPMTALEPVLRWTSGTTEVRSA